MAKVGKNLGMRLEKIDIEKLEPNPWNPNEMTEEMLSNLSLEIKRVGYLQPILVRPHKEGKYQIIDGEHRWIAMKRSGAKEMECVVVELDDTTARTVTLNMAKLRGETNLLKYAQVIRDLEKEIPLKELELVLYTPEDELMMVKDLVELPEVDMEHAKPPARLSRLSKVKCPACGKVFMIIGNQVNPDTKVEQ